MPDNQLVKHFHHAPSYHIHGFHIGVFRDLAVKEDIQL